MNANPNDEAVYGINHMADWTETEHKALLNHIPADDKNSKVRTFVPKGGDVDWRKTGDLTSVKDQG